MADQFIPCYPCPQVYQRVDVSAAELDNIVTLDIVGPWPIPAIQVTATLAHSLQTFGEGVRSKGGIHDAFALMDNLRPVLSLLIMRMEFLEHPKFPLKIHGGSNV